MKNIQIYFFLFMLLWSCGEDPDKTENSKENSTKAVENSTKAVNIPKETRFEMLSMLKDSIRLMDVNLTYKGQKLNQQQMITLKTKISVAKNEYVNQNLSYFKTFPEDSLAPVCLVNLFHFYDDNQIYHKAIDFIDTLELYYPKFKSLSDYIEWKAVTLDNDLKPRDTARIREAYEKLVSFPGMPAERKETYLIRLSNLHKDFNDLKRN